MKRISFLSVFLFSGFFLNVAEAACPTQSNLRIGNISGFLEGYTVCIGSPGNWQGQEYHQSGGALIDYKHGPKRAKLPGETGVGPWNDWTDQVGNWSVTGSGANATVSYDYNRDGAAEYSYQIYGSSRTGSTINGPYKFCNNQITVDIQSKKLGQVSCDQP